jgi:hypothetical protein
LVNFTRVIEFHFFVTFHHLCCHFHQCHYFCFWNSCSSTCNLIYVIYCMKIDS